jgi:hypothetical protein
MTGHKKPIIIGAALAIAALIILVFVFAQNRNTIPSDGGSVTVTRTAEFSFRPESGHVWSIYTTDSRNCDPYLEIYESQGRLLKSNDNDRDDGPDARIVLALISGEGATYITAHSNSSKI